MEEEKTLASFLVQYKKISDFNSPNTGEKENGAEQFSPKIESCCSVVDFASNFIKIEIFPYCNLLWSPKFHS